MSSRAWRPAISRGLASRSAASSPIPSFAVNSARERATFAGGETSTRVRPRADRVHRGGALSRPGDAPAQPRRRRARRHGRRSRACRCSGGSPRTLGACLPLRRSVERPPARRSQPGGVGCHRDRCGDMPVGERPRERGRRRVRQGLQGRRGGRKLRLRASPTGRGMRSPRPPRRSATSRLVVDDRVAHFQAAASASVERTDAAPFVPRLGRRAHRLRAAHGGTTRSGRAVPVRRPRRRVSKTTVDGLCRGPGGGATPAVPQDP